MWTEGTVNFMDGTTIKYEVKRYEEPSIFGIDGGKISKLYMKDSDGRCICNYDRGWDIEPDTDKAIYAYSIVIDKYN